ncbi:MAG: nucleotidyltransferase family protein, partial [bacterium]|nr:nucleotidyltransferase family protein [bacterium]
MNQLPFPRAVGIVAEYNPFHFGHAYHLQKAKEAAQADYVIVAMSGDFVQRGAPAVYDKYLRTEMALRGGAD